MKFTFIAEHDSGEKVTYECTKDFLHDILSDFELFLRGCGFVPKGNLEFFDNEEVVETTDLGDMFASMNPEDLEQYFRNTIDPVQHTQQYYDTERNR